MSARVFSIIHYNDIMQQNTKYHSNSYLTAFVESSLSSFFFFLGCSKIVIAYIRIMSVLCALVVDLLGMFMSAHPFYNVVSPLAGSM